MSISINDEFIWFCNEGLNGCSTIPIDYSYIMAYIILIALITGFIFGCRISRIKRQI